EIDRIDVREALEQDRLSFHDRLCGQRATIAEAENRGSIGNHRNEVALGGVVVRSRFIVCDSKNGNRDAGRIGERQVTLGRHWLGGDDFQLAWPTNAVKFQAFLISKAWPVGPGGGLGTHCYSMNATGCAGAGPGDVSGCCQYDSREGDCCAKASRRVSRAHREWWGS